MSKASLNLGYWDDGFHGDITHDISFFHFAQFEAGCSASLTGSIELGLKAALYGIFFAKIGAGPRAITSLEIPPPPNARQMCPCLNGDHDIFSNNSVNALLSVIPGVQVTTELGISLPGMDDKTWYNVLWDDNYYDISYRKCFDSPSLFLPCNVLASQCYGSLYVMSYDVVMYRLCCDPGWFGYKCMSRCSVMCPKINGTHVCHPAGIVIR